MEIAPESAGFTSEEARCRLDRSGYNEPAPPQRRGAPGTANLAGAESGATCLVIEPR